MPQEKTKDKWIVYAFYLIVVAWAILIAVGEFMLPNERSYMKTDAPLYDGTWVWIHGQERYEVELPNKFQVEEGKVLALQTVVPQNARDGMAFCFRASQQTVRIYVGQELRTVYDTSSSRPFGKNSISSFVFCPIGAADAGKTLQIQSVSNSMYSGVMNEVYYGNEMAVYNTIVRQNLPGVIIATFLLLMGVVVLCICLVMRVSLGKKLPLEYLAMCVIFSALWTLAESKLRQFVVPNITLVGIATFYIIMFIPFAGALYVDELQEQRYHKFYMFIQCLLIADAFVCTFFQLAEILDLLESMYFTHAIMIVLIAGIMVTMIRDIQIDRLQEYRLVAIGMLIFVVFTMVELGLVYKRTYKLVGAFLSIGLIVLLFTAAIKTVQDIVNGERSKQRAIATVEAKDAFLTRMSHEIRTPINSVLGMNEMILRENTNATINEYALNVERSGKVLLGLVNDILDLSKLQSGKMQLQIHPYAVAPMLMDLSNMFTERAEKKNLEFILDVEESFPTELMGDEMRIRQIIMNLLSNAVKYTKHGFVKLKVEGVLDEDGSYRACYLVEDSGQGIRPENQKLLFEQFSRLEEETNQTIEGTGLGLNITKNLVDMMNGTIQVDSEFGKGSVFRVEIPQEVFDITPIGDIANYRSVRPITEYREKLHVEGARILSVDDNEMNQAVLSTLLKKTGIRVETAESGAECLKLCAREHYDLIFMDHMMPGMDGIETFHHLRNTSGPNCQTKVVALTANAVLGIREMFLREGFCDYLTKPIDYARLQEVLVNHLPKDMIHWREEGWENTQPPQETTGNSDDALWIDRKEGMEYCAQDPDFYREMLQMFADQGENNLNCLRRYLEEENWKEYATYAHAVKSTAKSIGGGNFSQLAKEQEMQAKQENAEFLKTHFTEFTETYLAFLEVVKDLAKNE